MDFTGSYVCLWIAWGETLAILVLESGFSNDALPPINPSPIVEPDVALETRLRPPRRRLHSGQPLVQSLD
jgi:hypothetical protein